MFCPECGRELAGRVSSCPNCGTPIPQAAVARKKPRSPLATFLLCCLMPAVVVAFEFLFALPALTLGGDETLWPSIGGAVGGLVAIYLMGGRKLLHTTKETLLRDLKTAWIIPGVALVAAAFDLYATMSSGAAVFDGWPLRLLSLVVICLAIGLSEETMFRGVALHGLLALFGTSHRGVTTAVVLSTLLFGVAHIEWLSLNYGDGIQVLQAVLKVVQTGTFGFALAVIVLLDGNIVGSVLIHALYDFALMFTTYVVGNNALETEYVSTGSEGWETVVLYLAIIALFMPLVVKCARKLRREAVPTRGAFQPEE